MKTRTEIKFNSVDEKKETFLKELTFLLSKYKAELNIEHHDLKIVVDFDWDEDICKKTNSGIVGQLVLNSK